MFSKGTLGRTTLLAATLGGFLLLGGAAPAQARYRDDKCARRIHDAEERLEREIHRHGAHSRQARNRRHQLEEARERCRRDHDRRDHDRDDRRDRDRDNRRDRDR